MQKHAVAEGATRSAERSMSGLLRSYDAADRTALEAMLATFHEMYPGVLDEMQRPVHGDFDAEVEAETADLDRAS